MFQEMQPRRQGGSKPGWTLDGAGDREVQLQDGGHTARVMRMADQRTRTAEDLQIGKGRDLNNQKLIHCAGDDFLGTRMDERQSGGSHSQVPRMRRLLTQGTSGNVGSAPFKFPNLLPLALGPWQHTPAPISNGDAIC